MDESSSSNELVPITDSIPDKKGRSRIHSALRRLGRREEAASESGFNYERWLDPANPTRDTREHTNFTQSLAYKCGQVLKAKGYDYPLEPKITDGIAHGSDELLIRDYRYHTAVADKRDDGIWIGRDGKVIGFDQEELAGLEQAITTLDPEVRDLTQNRIVARYLLLRHIFFTDPLDRGRDFLTQEKLAKLMTEPVDVDENANPAERGGMRDNPQLRELFIKAAVAREAKGDALLQYDPSHNENTFESPRPVSGHELAVRREFVEQLPPASKIKHLPVTARDDGSDGEDSEDKQPNLPVREKAGGWLRNKFSRPESSSREHRPILYQPSSTAREDIYFGLAGLSSDLEEIDPAPEGEQQALLTECQDILNTRDFDARGFGQFVRTLARYSGHRASAEFIEAEGLEDPVEEREITLQQNITDSGTTNRLIAKYEEHDLPFGNFSVEEAIRWSDNDDQPTLHTRLENHFEGTSYDSYLLNGRVHSTEDGVNGSTLMLKRVITPQQARLACERVLASQRRSEEETEKLLKEGGLQELDTIDIPILPAEGEERERLIRSNELLSKAAPTYDNFDSYLKNAIRLVGGKAAEDNQLGIRSWEQATFPIDSYKFRLTRNITIGKSEGELDIDLTKADYEFGEDDKLQVRIDQYVGDDEMMYAQYEPRGRRLTINDIAEIIPETLFDEENSERIPQHRYTSIGIPKEQVLLLLHNALKRYLNQQKTP